MHLIKLPKVITRNPVTTLFYKTIAVPDDLSRVTTCNYDEETDPQDVGMSRNSTEAIWSCIEDLYKTGIYPGITACLRRHGKIVLKRAIGHSHGNGPDDHNDYNDDDDAKDDQKVLMDPDTPICQFSASKAVTAMLIHLLVEMKEINLLDPVTHYIPEFGLHGKENTSIYHLLSHRGGIPSPPRNTDPEILFDNEKFIDLLCKSKPAYPGGRQMAYHAITGGAILGEIIRRVIGNDARHFIRENIQKPLGFKYFNYGVDEKDIPRVATNYSTGLPLVYPVNALVKKILGVTWNDAVKISNDPRFMRTIIPAANIVATADEMSQFFQLLLNGGELNGVRIFKPLTVRRAIMETDAMKLDHTMIIPMRYSAGFMLGASPFGIWGPFSESAYGHVGFINIFCWADPDRDIAVSLQTTGKSLFGTHLIGLSKLSTYLAWFCRKVK